MQYSNQRQVAHASVEMSEWSNIQWFRNPKSDIRLDTVTSRNAAQLND